MLLEGRIARPGWRARETHRFQEILYFLVTADFDMAVENHHRLLNQRSIFKLLA